MFLKQMKDKRTGRVRLAVYESYWEGGKSHHRTVLKLGFLDELEKEHEDPISWAKALAAEMTAERKIREAPQMLEIHPAQRVDKRAGGQRRSIGAAVPACIYNALGIEKALRNNTAGSKATFDVNAALRLISIERMLSPGSKLCAWRDRGRYFFRSELSEDDVYRALPLIAECKGAVIGAMNRSIERAGMRAPLDNVFYDVTNYYFECDKEDDLRRKGVCKEHRPNPIVQMGLLQDRNAIPLTYRLFPGNASDCMTMLPIMEDMKREFGLGRVVAVADKGLNTSTNMALLKARGDGFVFSQSIRGTKSTASVREWVLSEAGYRGRGEGFKIKSRQGIKTIHLKAEQTASGKPEDVEVPVKMVAFFSAKYARRARAQRASTIAKAREMCARPARYISACNYGAAAYVQGMKLNKDTGEVADLCDHYRFNEAKLAAEEACDGYYLIITSEVEATDDKIVDTYRGLWQIEESFKVTKTGLSARPVYVRRDKSIEAHFLSCYIALTITRLLQLSLPNRPSAQAVLDDLRACEGTRAEGNWWLFDHRSDLTDEMYALIGARPQPKWMTTAQIKDMHSKKHVPNLGIWVP